MSPRPYRLGQRQAATEQTRARILSAARELLTTSQGFSGFSIDAVARQADVARMTVYHQFGSKIGLLEALFDSLASSGGMEHLASAFRQPEPLDTLDQYITVFSHFWESDRLVMRRIRALAALDPDFEQVIRARDERRRHGLHVIVQRLAEKHGRPIPSSIDEVVNVLYTLIGFECFDTLAGSTRSIEEVTLIVQQLALATLDLVGGHRGSDQPGEACSGIHTGDPSPGSAHCDRHDYPGRGPALLPGGPKRTRRLLQAVGSREYRSSSRFLFARLRRANR